MTIKILDEDVVYFGSALSDDPLVAGMRISERLLFGTATAGGGKPTINVLLSGVSPLTLLNAVSLNYIKAFGKCEQRNLPKGYKQLEYIIFDSTQVLDTGFTPNNNSRIESKCYRTGTNCWFYGASPNNPRVTIYHSTDGTSRWGNQSRSNFGFSASTKYTLIQDKNGLSINGTLYPWDTGTAGDFTCDRSLTIGNNNGSTGTRYFAGNFYYMKIYDNNVLVRDYVPVKRISDNSLGIYDRVNDTFLTASGFTAGAEVTPSPDNVMPIWCNNGAIKAFCGNKWTDVNNLSGYIIQNQSGVIQENSNYNVSAPILLKAGDYSVSYYAPSTGARPFTIWECDAQGDLVGENYIFNITRPDVGTNTGTFTIDRDMYVRISWRKDFTNIVVAPTTAIIYYDGTVETVQAHGKNLFDRDTVGIEDGAIASATGKNTSNSARCRTTNYVPVNPNTTYTVSAVIDGYISSLSAGIYVLEYTADSGNFESNYTGTSSGWKNPNGYSFTTGNTTHGIRFVFAKTSSAEISPSDITNIQVEVGSTATTYEPYFEGTTATCQPLLSVGTTKDVQNITNGAITRNVGVMVLDGTEEGWSRNSDRASLLIPDILNGSNSWMPICTHYKTYHGGTSLANMDDNSCKITSGGKSLLIKDTTHNTSLTDFTDYIKAQYAAGTPVIIVYPLATPTTETVTGQTLAITQGTNIVTAEGSVSDLELEVSYKAYAEVTVEEIEAVNTDENVEVIIS